MPSSMLSPDLVVVVALLYVTLLFGVAFAGDRRARTGRLGWLESPVVYTLSISIYCTSWTFYGAVGSAARSGLEFATIYIGPTLVFVGWWFLLRKLVRIGQLHRITSIADMISSRYGKSAAIAALVTLIAVAASTPYIALQLKAMTNSFQVISSAGPDAWKGIPGKQPNFELALGIAAGMALFTILFGTRNLDANERHHGVVAAIALEAVVKLAALLGVGLLVLLLAGGPEPLFERMPAGMLGGEEMFGTRWVTMTLLAGAAVVCLPRQFQVTVVEASDESHLRTASWLFPLYLLLMSLCVLPIAIAGLGQLPRDANPDMFVLTVPMWTGHDGIALFAFLGGFSSATSMVIVACIALSTMVSNHLVLPLALRLPWLRLGASGEIRRFLLRARRASICFILLLAFLYFRWSGRFDALASIGLIAFAGAAQLLPVLVGGLFWRQATARGAAAGLAGGAGLWAYTLFLPSFRGDLLLGPADIAEGLGGIALLRPYALLGLDGLDPLMHSLFWSLSANTLLFVVVSLLSEPRPLERLQGALFVDVFRHRDADTTRFVSRSAAAFDLNVLAQRLIGVDEARRFFQDRGSGELEPHRPIAGEAQIVELERKLAGSVGAATARAMVSQVVTGETISLRELMKLADESQRVREDRQRLQRKSEELAAVASELQAANERLRRLDSQKDDFLSQVSHEVRTPMASIRSFTEILLDAPDLADAKRQRYLSIVHEESIRLTRLLDAILDIGALEGEGAPWASAPVDLQAAVDAAVEVCEGMAAASGVQIRRPRPVEGACVLGDADRLRQVLINLLSNAIKYNTSAQPWVEVEVVVRDGAAQALVRDNGPGIPAWERERVFHKFSRGAAAERGVASGAGLGLAISGQIVRRLGGSLGLRDEPAGGACFVVRLPLFAAGADADPGRSAPA